MKKLVVEEAHFWGSFFEARCFEARDGILPSLFLRSEVNLDPVLSPPLLPLDDGRLDQVREQDDPHRNANHRLRGIPGLDCDTMAL